MKKIKCYKCNGDKHVSESACKFYCKNKTSDDCYICHRQYSVVIHKCYVCDGKGYITWIDQMFRKE